jgi:hypothetical protein
MKISTHESHTEEDFFFQIEAFLNELEPIRLLVLLTWQYRGTDRITKSIVTNPAIDLVRRREYELEIFLVHLSKYPVERFPTGGLAALLL